MPRAGAARRGPGGPPHGTELVIRPEPGAADSVDVVFPVLHGTFGEDGTIQGLYDYWILGRSAGGAAPPMRTSIASRRFASLYFGVIKLPSGRVTSVTRFSAS